MKTIQAFSVSALCLALLACGDSGSNDDDNNDVTDACSDLDSSSFSCETMLNNIQNNAIETTVTQLSADLAELKTSVDAYCQDIDGANESASLASAQTSWQTAANTLEQLEVMQIGPVTAVRDEIYSWPLVDSCKIDEQIILSASDSDISGVTPQRRGMFAVEYTLFNSNLDHSCPSTNTALNPTSGTPWNSMADADRKAERCGFAQKALSDVITRVAGLETELESYDITTAFNGLQQAANAVSDGIFYFEKQTKDAKLIAALPELSTDSFDPSALESQYAHYSKEMMLNNVIGVEALFTANDTMGLDDYLVAADQEAIATEMKTALTDIKTALQSINGDFHTILSNASAADVDACINAGNDTTDLEKLCSLPAKVKAFTDVLKGSFILALQFSAPANVEGDND